MTHCYITNPDLIIRWVERSGSFTL